MDNKIKELIKENKIKILGASKTKSKEEIYKLYNEGIKIFGENYVQELKEKWNITWRYIAMGGIGAGIYFAMLQILLAVQTIWKPLVILKKN